MNKVITIGREFGSGGREIGLKLAEKLEIPFYDKELISIAAKDNGFSPELLDAYDEKVCGAYFSGIFGIYQQPLTDQIYLAQCKVIKQLADKGPCVIVGRCADHVLEGESINVFVHADIGFRVKRKNEMDTGVAPEKMKSHILSVDKQRKKYYEFYTGRKWGMSQHQHLCVDTTHVGVDGAARTIYAYVKSFE